MPNLNTHLYVQHEHMQQTNYQNKPQKNDLVFKH